MGRRIVLQNADLRVVCLPGHGMLITEIVPQSHGANLLWQRQDGPLHDFDRPATATSEADPFDEQVFAGGWFGMFPNAGIPGVLDSGEQMHGSFPREAWKVVHQGDATLSCTLETDGFEAVRTLRLTENTVRVDTEVTNVRAGDREVSFGEHPCFSREVFGGGTVLVEADGAHTTNEVSEPGANRFAAGQEFVWPHAEVVGGGVARVDLVPVEPDASHDHLCVRLADPCVEISVPRLGGKVSVRSDMGATPNLLFWRHFRPPASPWRGDVFGIEMMSTPGRTRDDARAADALRVVRQGETVKWYLAVSWDVRPISAYS